MQQIFGPKPWKSYRLWLLVIVTSYTLCGFLLLPYVLKTQLLNYVDSTLKQQADLETVRFNPFLLRLHLQNFQVQTPAQEPLLSFDELTVDFDSFGLFRRAWKFSTISITGVDVFVEIDKEGELNLGKLAPPTRDETKTQNVDKTPGTLPRLILQNITINQGRLRFRQLDRTEPFNLDLNPLNSNIANFSTLPEDDGHYSFNAQFSDSETLGFTGALQLEPLVLDGHITLGNFELSRGGDYLQEQLLFKVTSGRLSIDTDFTLSRSDPQHPQNFALQASNIVVAVKQLQLNTLPPIEPLLAMHSITLNQGRFMWPEQTLSAEALVIEQGTAHSWLTPNKVFNYAQLIKNLDPETKALSDKKPASPAESLAAPKPWQLHLEQIQLKTLLFSFDDRSLGEPTRQTVEIADLSLSPFTLKQGAKFNLHSNFNINKAGRATIDGSVGVMPPIAVLAITLHEVALPPLSNYLHEFIQLNLTEGLVDANLKLDYGNSLALSGDIGIKQLNTFDLVDQENWLKWQNLSIDTLAFTLEPASVNIANIELTKPYFDAVIFDNGETRLSRMLGSATKQPVSSANGKPLPTQTRTSNSTDNNANSFAVTIDQFKLIDGSMDFKDFNLPLDFATHIHSINGQASDLSTNSSKPAELIFDGKIDGDGSAKINATTQLSSPQAFSEITLNFNNVDITSASSYSGKFAGYAIDAGTLSLNLDYRIKRGQMLGDNKILLEHLTLGDSVKSPDAVSLPLKLAVALMKDVNGNIDIDLPVEGDLNNPKVRIGSIIWKAFTNLLIKVAASPFKMLGGLFENGDDSSLENIVFYPGSSELSEKELEDLNKLAQGLQLKSQLALTISACYDPETDHAALQARQFNAAYSSLADGTSSDSKEDLIAPPNYQNHLLKKMYLAAFSEDQLAQLQADNEQVITNQQTGDVDHADLLLRIESRGNEQLLQQLINAQILGPTATIELANQRARAIFAYIAGDDALSEPQIHIREQPLIVRADKGKVICPLTLSAL